MPQELIFLPFYLTKWHGKSMNERAWNRALMPRAAGTLQPEADAFIELLEFGNSV
jgi:hypothetical protein